MQSKHTIIVSIEDKTVKNRFVSQKAITENLTFLYHTRIRCVSIMNCYICNNAYNNKCNIIERGRHTRATQTTIEPINDRTARLQAIR